MFPFLNTVQPRDFFVLCKSSKVQVTMEFRQLSGNDLQSSEKISDKHSIAICQLAENIPIPKVTPPKPFYFVKHFFLALLFKFANLFCLILSDFFVNKDLVELSRRFVLFNMRSNPWPFLYEIPCHFVTIIQR